MSNPVTTAIAQVLTKGMHGPAVETLQIRLVELGYMTQDQKNSGPGKFGQMTEAAVKNLQSDNMIAPNGKVDVAAQSLLQQMKNGVRLDSQGGVVLPMQRRLANVGALSQNDLTAESAKFGPRTEQALRDFQTGNGLQSSGVLTPETYRPLYIVGLGDGGIDVQLPEKGEGFRTFLRENGTTQYGTEKAIKALIELAGAWIQIHPEVPLQYGHISRKGGGPFFSTVNMGHLAHQTHKDGLTVDVRPIRKDNQMRSVDIGESQYDRARTKELVQLIRQRHPNVRRIFFNDATFIQAHLTRRADGHDDHLHVELSA
jgi:peptidoglycan hydrolase-like protein with peptidoglycan-binding domain